MTEKNSEQQSNIPPASLPPGYFPPPYPFTPTPSVDDEIDLRELLRVLRANARLILKITLVTTLLATIAAFVMTPKYKGEVLLAPAAPQTGHGGLSSLINKFGGLASMVGVSLPGAGDADSAFATLTSRKTLLSYVKENNLKPILFYKRWDADKNKWKVNRSHWLKDILHIPLDENPSEQLAPGEPTDGQTYKLLSKRIVRVSQDKSSSLITLDVIWRDPAGAAAWANGLVAYANSELRKRDINDAERMIAYLTAQANKTDNPDIRTGLYQMIESQEQTAAVAASTTDYAFRIIDPAVPADLNNRVRPKRGLMIILALLGGMFIGGAYVLVRHAIKAKVHSDAAERND